MDVDGAQLQDFRQQIERKERLKTLLDSLYVQKQELEIKVKALFCEKEEEQRDVDRLESRGLTALFYNIIGKMDEKLTEEQREAYAAAAKYAAAKQELESVEYNIDLYEKELDELDGCEVMYEQAFKLKEESIRNSGTAEAERVLALEEEIAQLDKQLKEIEEALCAGEKAVYITTSVLGKLESAEAWGTWDMLGGGFISTMAKHENLDDAQTEIADLQTELRRFKTELTDVDIEAGLQLHIDGFLGFADYIFDGIFVDWAVQDRIKNSKMQVEQIKNKIEEVMQQLEVMQKASATKKKELKKELEKVIVG